jgi:hypothetical protein
MPTHLRLVHHDRRGAARFRQRQATLDEQIGVAQVFGAFGRPGEIQPDRRFRQHFPQQRGLAGLAGAEHEMHVWRSKFPFPQRFCPATKHIGDFINARLF